MKKIIFLCLSILFICGGISTLFYDGYESHHKQEEVYTVDFVVGGDIMLSRGIGRWNKRYGYDRTFSGNNYNPLTQYDCYQSGDCLLVFNLESMFSKKDNDQPYGGFSFRSNIGNLQYLLDIRKNNDLVLSLANNHTNNAGGGGMIFTRDVLSGENIGYFGAGSTTGEAEEIYSIEKNGILLCFQAFSYDGTHGIYGGEYLAWNSLKEELINESLNKMDQIGCEVKILMPHWGNEYRIHPNQWQRELAYKMVDEGADIILGGHSHIPGSYEEYKGKSIFYSFGNFIFDQDWGKKSSGGGFDYVYDFELKRKTVPTYIALLAGLKVIKQGTGITIEPPEFKMARINKGLYDEIDQETFSGIMENLQF